MPETCQKLARNLKEGGRKKLRQPKHDRKVHDGPGSYETGAACKDHGGKTRVCLAYPNTYRIGMSSLGLRLVYGMLNYRDDVVCERVFLPEPGAPPRIYTVESQKIPSEFDIMAFSISYENDFPNVVKILRASGIPLYARDRASHYPLLIMGGPCAFMNPEPIADFFDVVVVAEAEAVLDGLMDMCREYGDRTALLAALAGVDGMYIPAQRAKTIKRRFLIDMDVPRRAENLSQLMTPNTEFSAMYLVEAMRGCPWRCRFCAISGIYGKVRMRSLSSIQQEIEDARGLTKRVGVIGASLTDYPHIGKLLCIEGVEFSLSSLRASEKAAEITSLIRTKKSVSIAPEAGSKRLRAVINKKITHDDIVGTSRLVLANGIAMLRLYFMIGLPTETSEDIQEMIALVKEIRGVSKNGRIVLSVSPFVPKPFTPFQWHPMADHAVVVARMKQLKDGLKRQINVKVTHDALRNAYIEGLFAMGDRCVSPIVESLADGTDWEKACKERSIDASAYIYRKKAFDERLPWDFIDNGIDKASLWREYCKAEAL